jgi:hypothetical protein
LIVADFNRLGLLFFEHGGELLLDYRVRELLFEEGGVCNLRARPCPPGHGFLQFYKIGLAREAAFRAALLNVLLLQLIVKGVGLAQDVPRRILEDVQPILPRLFRQAVGLLGQ